MTIAPPFPIAWWRILFLNDEPYAARSCSCRCSSMTFPPEKICMSCHASVKKESPEIQKVSEFAAKRKPVPQVRIYQLMTSGSSV